jgi:hypothetical protein
VLSGAKVLTTALGAVDEARLAFLDVTSGTGGTVTVPAVAQGHFVRNASAGDAIISAGGAAFTFKTGDIGPVFSDGASVYGLALGGKPLRQFIGDANQAVIDYINAAISAGSINLPPALGNLGKALVVRLAAGVEAWVPDFIQTLDVDGGAAVAFALTL